MAHKKKHRQEKSGHNSEDAHNGKEENPSGASGQKGNDLEDNEENPAVLQNHALLSAVNMAASTEAGEDDTDEEEEENEIDEDDDD